MTPRVLSIILLVLCLVCAVMFTSFGFEWITTDHPYGWLGATLLFGFGSFLPEK